MYKTISDIEEIIKESSSHPVLIYKHSSMCGTSVTSAEEVKAFMQESGQDVYRVVVPEERPLSNEIEKRLGIRHESPQLLIVQDGKGKAIDHFEITLEKIKTFIE